MRKRANAPVPVSSFGAAFRSPQFLAAVAAPLALVGANMLQDRSRRRQEVEDKSIAYRDMMSLHPHLGHKDQATIGRIYSSLYRASPHMAKDPMVAGAWVDNVLENKTPGMNSHQAILNAVKDLSGIEKNVTDSQRSRQQMTERWGPLAANTITNVLHTYGDLGKHDLDTQFAAANKELDEQRKDIADRTGKLQLMGTKLKMWSDSRDLHFKGKEMKSLERNNKLRDMIKDIRATRAEGSRPVNPPVNPLEGMHFGGAGNDPEQYRGGASPSHRGQRAFSHAQDEARQRAFTPHDSPGAGNLSSMFGEAKREGEAHYEDIRPGVFKRFKTSSAEPTLRDHLAALKV